MIYIFGDSHSAIFTIKNNKSYMTPELEKSYFDKFISYRTFPFTCYNLDKKVDILESYLTTLDIKKNDYLFFSYGEPDIRCHIGFNSKDEITLNNSIDICINSYINVLLKFKNKYNNIGVWSPIASGISNGPQGNNRIPSYKSCIERNYITKLFSQKLEKKCIEHNIIYKSIFSELVNSDMTTKNEYYVDGIHLGFQAKEIVNRCFNL